MLAYYWLFMVFVIGVAVGSFLNVAIARLPLEKSLMWPGSRCGSCLQAVPWYHNFPLFSYLILRGRCGNCGARFSSQYFWVELLTGLGFAGLFYVEVMLNVHGWPDQGLDWNRRMGIFHVHMWLGFLYHALLFSFLMAASVCDLNGREIPLQLTLTGTCLGLIFAVLLPWPWPLTMNEAVVVKNIEVEFRMNAFATEKVQIKKDFLKQGIYPLPAWWVERDGDQPGHLPALLQPGGTWNTGLVTGIIGALVGTFMLRIIRFLFSTGLGKEALGLGDADLMMMAGAFLGWQVVVISFFVSVFPALVIGILQMIFRRDSSLPFGPSLAAGILITFLGWNWIGPEMQSYFFWTELVIFLAVGGSIFFFVASFAIRIVKKWLGITEESI